MTNTLIPIIVGALIGIVPSIINKYFDSKNELEKWKREKRLERKLTFQSQLASAGKQLLTLQNSINWLCWIVNKTPSKLTVEIIEQYDQETKVLFPQILAELIEIAVINEKAYIDLNSVFGKLADVDAKLSLILSQSVYNDKINIVSNHQIDALLIHISSLKNEVIEKVKNSLKYNK